ncbi:MAG: thioredoxin family protein [Planctomycetes bacterium]|nr:thioredoxin family protein [Planctomycetota bacterium]
MKTLSIAAAVFLAFSSIASAQSNDDLKKRKEKELQEPFLKKAAWILDYDKALAAAKKSGKPIFAYFTRSYAD